VREVPVAPEALLSRLRAELAKRPKRALFVLKVHSEWLGLVHGDRFVVWERSGHATHARGRIVRRAGGSRVEARIGPTRRTLVLGAAFFVLFGLAAYGLLGREEGLGHGPLGIALAVGGAAVLLGMFLSATRRQQDALRAFLDGVFLPADG